MKASFLAVVAFVFAVWVSPVVAGIVVYDASSALESGTLVLEEASGTGASSGSSVKGVLANTTNREVHVDIFMAKPLYLVNSGSGQNMIASQVYGKDGAYRSDGKRSFITLKPRERMPVVFIAYCADFEKDNPSISEYFVTASAPDPLLSVMQKITDHSKRFPEQDITAAAQVAVWLAQGESIDHISEKFQFTAEDAALARRLAE